MTEEIARTEGHALQPTYDPIEAALAPQAIVRQVALIQEVMKAVMRKDEHYGVIPGTGQKPSLLKPGAEKLGLTFRLAPRFKVIERDLLPGTGHREYRVDCELVSITSGQFIAMGVGSCSTMESKYRYRTGPVEDTGVVVPRDYWADRDSTILARAVGEANAKGLHTKKIDNVWKIVRAGDKVEHDNPADYYNTCLKMAKKRAHVDAILTATAASDIFTQDVEDLPTEPEAPQASSEAPAAAAAAPATTGRETVQEPAPTFQDDGDVPWPGEPGYVEPEQKEVKLASEAQVKKIFALGHKLGWDSDKIKVKIYTRFDVNDMKELTGGKTGTASQAIEMLDNTIKAQAEQQTLET